MNPLDELNKKRKKCVPFAAIGIGCFIGFGFCFILCILSFFSFDMAFGLFPFMFIFVLAGTFFGAYSRVKFSKVSKEFKDVYLKKIIEEKYPSLDYNPNSSIPLETIYESNLVKRADKYNLEDLIEGQYDGVSFRVCDVLLEERHEDHDSNGSHTSYVAYFQGRFFEFDFNKNFKGLTVVSEGKKVTWNSELEKIELDREDFNNIFNTYTTDEHYAFYILTSHFMESLMEIEKRYEGNLSISFLNSKMYIALNDRSNSFELKIFKEINEELINSFLKDLQIIPDMIKVLKLNKNIFKEEE